GQGVRFRNPPTSHRQKTERAPDFSGARKTIKILMRSLHLGCATTALFFAAAALSLGTFAFAADARLLVKSPLLHLFEDALLGQLAFEHSHRLIKRAFDPYFHSPPSVQTYPSV